MKTKLISLLCSVCLSLVFVNSAKAMSYDPIAVSADALVARPLCFAATLIGGAVFLVALPIAATSGSINSTADALVRKPAWATFRRPLGDFGYEEEYITKRPRKQETKRVYMTRRYKHTRA